MKKNSYIKLMLVILFTSAVRLFSYAEEVNKEFKIKGFHLDLRCEVMTLPALKNFAKELADFGINTLIMEWEGTFPFSKHATLPNQFAYSKEEVKSFISYCSGIGIDVIPLQNCFGHVEYILRHDRYVSLREDFKEVSQVCPLKLHQNIAVFTELFTEVAELHPSKYFHIGCDETRLLGSCKKCQAFVQEHGKSALFVNYVKEMCDIVISLGKQPVIWGDILLKNPEAADKLPKNIIVIDWNYGWDINLFGNVDELKQKGITFWGAPSIRSQPDNQYLTQWDVHFKNLHDFIPYARSKDHEGIIMTSWSTSGLYGFQYDMSWEILEMFPIRYVYPLSGFRMLLAAYAESLKTSTPVDVDAFILNYATERFGLDKFESELFLNAILTPQEQVLYFKTKKGQDVKSLLEVAMSIQKNINSLHPEKNKKEFEHLKLMFDMRTQYLMFKEIESRYQSTDFSSDKVKSMQDEIQKLIKSSAKIDNRFLKLNKNYLYKEELLRINQVRNKKMNNLYSNLKNSSSKH